MGANCGCGIDPKAQTAGNDIDCDSYYTERNLNEVQEWLNDLDLSQYYENFIDHGFDRMDIIKANMKNNTILKRIGIEKIGHQMVIIKSIEKFNEYENENENEDETITNISSTNGFIDRIICDDEPLIPSW
eukprot:CAMPEP_0201583632 /NCGR_PEP_ID=MMETSP0190_2-20130828/100777_1 /ASSEMBLY_ACC=CAM_ASM_000263 /TAXON_ID=37353 /ORGANISM="Rosalina sp." /LENGTH=130 /DNA_ID=CAMNT_0048025911 /DNA_START=23 /DNA_END=412 /DNA_ORIENTATION=+